MSTPEPRVLVLEQAWPGLLQRLLALSLRTTEELRNGMEGTDLVPFSPRSPGCLEARVCNSEPVISRS